MSKSQQSMQPRELGQYKNQNVYTCIVPQFRILIYGFVLFGIAMNTRTLSCIHCIWLYEIKRYICCFPQLCCGLLDEYRIQVLRVFTYLFENSLVGGGGSPQKRVIYKKCYFTVVDKQVLALSHRFIIAYVFSCLDFVKSFWLQGVQLAARSALSSICEGEYEYRMPRMP